MFCNGYITQILLLNTFMVEQQDQSNRINDAFS